MQEADAYYDDTANTCSKASNGFYSGACSNTLLQCATPSSMNVKLFQALTSFTSPGHGDSLGCEVSLAFPFVMLSNAGAVDAFAPKSICSIVECIVLTKSSAQWVIQ